MALLFCLAGCAAAGFVICPRCGYENADTESACTHCQAAFPAAERGDADPKGASPEGAAKDAPAANTSREPLVAADIARGQVYLEQGATELARLFFRNAAALNMMSGNGDRSRTGQRIVALLNQCAGSRPHARRDCIVCGGSGWITPPAPSLAGSSAGLQLPRRQCKACGGTGGAAWGGTVDDRKYVRGRAVRQYRTLQRARGYNPLGGAWLPPGRADELDVRQRVRIKRATAPPCTACLGFGRTDCRECNGQGRVACPERDCVNGKVTVEDAGGLTRSTVTRTRACRVCDGRGVVACEACHGRGSVLCEDCNGTGEQERCRRCGGEGAMACRRCDGTGRRKGLECRACGGEGVSECSSCNGDGRRE